METPQIIDYWSNIFTPDGLRKMYLENDELGSIVKWWNMNERLTGYHPEEFVEMMDSRGIAKVYVPAFKMWSYRKRAPLLSVEVDAIADIMRRTSGRVGGLFGIDLTAGMKGVAELEFAVRELGFEGAHLHSLGYGLPLNHRDIYPYYAKCAELGIPIVVQSGHSAERMPSAMGQPILLDDVALYFPELKIVASHMGWPWVEELIALAWKHPNLYIGCGAHAPKYWDPKLIQFMNTRRGRGKVLWGTVFPVLTHEDSLRQVEELGLKPESRDALLFEAAAKVFGTGQVKQ